MSETVFTAYPQWGVAPGCQKSYLTVDPCMGGDGVGNQSMTTGPVLRGPSNSYKSVGIILYVIGIPASMFYLVYSARKNQDEGST